MNIKFNVNTKTKIRFNGQEYDSVEAMPPEARKVYEEALAKARSSPGGVQIKTSTKIRFNGQEYANPEAMPADVRSQYDQVMAMLDKNHNGIPDILEGGQLASGLQTGQDPTLLESKPLVSQMPASPQKSARSGLIVLIALLILAGLAALVILSRFAGR